MPDYGAVIFSIPWIRAWHAYGWLMVRGYVMALLSREEQLLS
ncbi:MAG: hypothetical protein SPJ34_04830 [Candidatus Ornithospirochaeta sp.]|nr:hypothetical protein [Candidatus Ornithospirochaeta sp.]